MSTACRHRCRPPCSYAVGVAKAPGPLGPYVKDAANPIMGSGPVWKCPGHGSTVDDVYCNVVGVLI